MVNGSVEEADGGGGDDRTRLITSAVFGSRMFAKSEAELPPTIKLDPVPGTSLPIIYSEPALSDLTEEYPFSRNRTLSDTALAFISDSGISSLVDNGNLLSPQKSIAGSSRSPSSCFSDSRQSFLRNHTRTRYAHSFSTSEVREQHAEIQKKYRPQRRRRYTDPVDFEGILNIIGGCSWWQIWVYSLIIILQVPHAMFNLSVIYMMYQPDHWCKVPDFNDSSSSFEFKWSLKDALNTSIVFPRISIAQRALDDIHDQCHYYNRGETRFNELRNMSLEDAVNAVENETVAVVKCTEWEYVDDVMKSTIVTQWNLVCSDNFKRAHAHVFYAFGYLFGSVLGGIASDRFGRKPTIIGFGILSAIFGLFLPYSTYFPLFLFVRFLSAICNEAAHLAAYVLCMEVTGMRYRAMIGSLLQAPWAIGYVLLALIAYISKSWQHIQLIIAAFHTAAMISICALPESPRWLIVSNRVREAERYIRKACRDPPFPFNVCRMNHSRLPCDLEITKHAEQSNWLKRNQRPNILTLLKSRVLCCRMLIVSFIWAASALVYYGLVIALSDQSAPGKVLSSGNFFVNNAIAGAIELPTLLSCVYLMRFGRKKSQMFTLVFAALFILFAIAAVVSKHHTLALICLLLAKVSIQGAFNILHIFTSELYPTVIRNTAVGFNSMIARFGSGIASYIAILSDVTLPIVPMIVFSMFSFLASIMVIFLPETHDRPLPDTLKDAVTFLRNDMHYQCLSFGMNKASSSSMNCEKDIAISANDVDSELRSVDSLRSPLNGQRKNP